MNEKQKKALRNLKIIEFVLAIITIIVAYQIIKYQYFNGATVDFASWTWGLLVWTTIWLVEYRKLSHPEE